MGVMQIRHSSNGLYLECPICKHAIQRGVTINQTSRDEGVISLPFVDTPPRAS